MPKKYIQHPKNKCALCFFTELNTNANNDESQLNFVEYAIPDYFDVLPKYILNKNKEYSLFLPQDIYIKYLKMHYNNIMIDIVLADTE